MAQRGMPSGAPTESATGRARGASSPSGGGSTAPPAGVLTLDPEAEDLLVAFAWPGNVRQLENVLHRAAILADGGCIRVADLPPEVSRTPARAAAAAPSEDHPPSLRERVRRFEIALIRRAVEEAGGDRRLAAQRLGIGLSSLYRKLEEFEADSSIS
jgi:two-component system response regulator AtoC